MDDLVGRSVIVSGRVQGVFYRASTAEQASQLGLQGWVKNLPNGDVQIEVFGQEADVERLISWCKQGPPMAKVTGVQTDVIDFRKELPFRVVY